MEEKKEIKVGIIGCGYVGRPLLYLVAKKGYSVVGIDNDKSVILEINRNKDMIKQRNKIVATDDYLKLKECNIIIVCVPTPTKSKIPDLSIIENVVEIIGKVLSKKSLIIVESTLAPGMVKKYFQDKLFDKFNLKLNYDYELAYCPERIDPGNDKLWVENINRVCGASSSSALEKTYKFYSSILSSKICKLNSIEEAELVKTWENSMRNVSIAQANLLAKICDRYGFEIDNILNGLNSKVEQFKIKLAYPGIGPGGHCIPEDIHYLIQSLEEKDGIELLKNSVNINQGMPTYVLDKLKLKLKINKDNLEELNILMLGKSYKANTKDTRCSTAIDLYNIIKKENHKIDIVDPLIDYNENECIEEFLNEKLTKADVIILSCPHDVLIMKDYTKYKNVKYIVDCWNKLDKSVIIEAGIEYVGVGK